MRVSLIGCYFVNVFSLLFAAFSFLFFLFSFFLFFFFVLHLVVILFNFVKIN